MWTGVFTRTDINHAAINHGNIPLWVLVNALTFGNISKFYLLSAYDIQTKIAKNYVEINESQLAKILIVLTGFQNVCAHGERLFYQNRCIKIYGVSRKLGGHPSQPKPTLKKGSASRRTHAETRFPNIHTTRKFTRLANSHHSQNPNQQNPGQSIVNHYRHQVVDGGNQGARGHRRVDLDSLKGQRNHGSRQAGKQHCT